MLILFGLSLNFTSCEKENHEATYPTLQVINDLGDDWRSITVVSLVGYTFDNLDIRPFGESQSFILDKGMPGGYENINVTVRYIRYRGVDASRSLKIDFSDSQTTSIKLTGCDSAEGCPGIYLE